MPSPRPSPLDQAATWRTLRLDPREAESLVRDFKRRQIVQSWTLAEAAQDHVVTELSSVAWSSVSGATLLVLVEGHCALYHARDHMLPSRLAPASVQGRWLLLLHHLWREADRAEADPSVAVLNAIVQWQAGLMALKETRRRLLDERHGHIGVWAAVFVLLARWAEIDPLDAVDDAEVANAVEHLRKLAYENLPQYERKRDFADLSGELTSAVADRLLTKFAGANPIAVVVDALDGLLNVEPRGIADTLRRRTAKDHERRPNPRSQRDDQPSVTAQRRRPAQIVDRTIEVVFDRESIPTIPVDRAIDSRDMLDRAKGLDGETVEALEQAWDDGASPSRMRSNAARRLKITPQGLGKRIQKLQQQLLGVQSSRPRTRRKS